ncbi:MAG: hypothetical protein HW390_3532 [Candidatus Brocadiaceae bacterium]|nr:hypothetical protein [Candidatus Brocadiaceae bacterium]
MSLLQLIPMLQRGNVQYIYHFIHYMSTNDVEIHQSDLNCVASFGMVGDEILIDKEPYMQYTFTR